MTDSLHFDSSYWIPNLCQCNLDSRFPAFTGFRVLEQTVPHCSAFQKQKIPGFRNPDYLTWAEMWSLTFLRDPPGSTPLYIDMYRPRVFAPLWSENKYRLCSFWSGIGCGFQGNCVSVRRYLLFHFQMWNKEREICEFEIDFKKFFLLLL